jgi:hypothetical protein
MQTGLSRLVTVALLAASLFSLPEICRADDSIAGLYIVKGNGPGSRAYEACPNQPPADLRDRRGSARTPQGRGAAHGKGCFASSAPASMPTSYSMGRRGQDNARLTSDNRPVGRRR